MHSEDLERLAQLRHRLGGALKPWRRKLDAEGAGVAVDLPNPETFAHYFPPRPAGGHYRNGAAGVVDVGGDALDLEDLAGELVTGWRSLPPRADGGEVYRALRTLVAVSPQGAAIDYARDVTRAWRRGLPRRPRETTRKHTASLSPARSVAERVRDHRARARTDEIESSGWWLQGWLTGWDDGAEIPEPGSTVSAPALLGDARAFLGDLAEEYEEEVTRPDPRSPYAAIGRAAREKEWCERAEDEDLPSRPRVPGARTFYRTADEVLGPRRRSTGGTRVYTVPDTDERGEVVPAMAITDEEITEAIEVREIVARLREQRRRLSRSRDAGGRFAATGTDGGIVISLDEHRAV